MVTEHTAAAGTEHVRATKEVRLAYGRGGLRAEVPAIADVLEPRYVAALADAPAAIRAALRAPIASRPLRELVPDCASVGVVICDHTRPFPARLVLPVLFEELDHVDPSRITIFVATGTHRRSSDAELQEMLGPQVLAMYRVVQHDALDAAQHTRVGSVLDSDVPALIETGFREQDVRITTGFIEPHFFAGCSGGPKMVAPGLAALATVLELHSAARVGHPRATWGITRGNPIHDAVRAIAGRVGINFNLDVTLNREHAITNVFAGALFDSHAAGCAFVRETAMTLVAAPYDVVVTTNSGYPLDQNLYQSVKGMSAAAQIVTPGGAIVLASECSDGLPDQGGYKQLLYESAGPDAFLARLGEPGFVPVHDQWEVQVQALIQRKARVFVKSGGLSPADLRAAWLEPVDDISACVSRLVDEYGPNTRVAVLPEGPQTIPYVRN
jgi:lactate racemase